MATAAAAGASTAHLDTPRARRLRPQRPSDGRCRRHAREGPAHRRTASSAHGRGPFERPSGAWARRSPGRAATGASGSDPPAPCGPRPSYPPRTPGRSAVIWIGRSAGDSRWSTIGRPPAVRMDGGAEQVLHAHRGRRFVARVVDRAPSGRSAASSAAGASSSSSAPSRPRQLRAQHHRQVDAARGRRAASPRGRYGASHSSSVAAAHRCSNRATARRPCGAGTRPAGGARSTPPTSRAPRVRCRERGRAAPPWSSVAGRRRADRLAEPHRAQPAFDALDEVVAVGVPFEPTVSSTSSAERGERRRRRRAPRRA